jgi:DnaJ domain
LTILGKSVEELTRAYRILDTPASASALAIKSNYRKLIKRWHPDKPATNAATHDEAVMMTKLINEAFTLIENAPLRYYSEPAPDAVRTPTEARIRNVNEVDLSKMFFNEKRIEYAVRIACGAISGAFVGLAFSLDVIRDGTGVMVAVALCAVGFAIGTMKYGDRFWRGVLGIWWRWE